MGTTVLRKAKGITTADFFAQEFGEKYAKAVVATATKPSVFYAVVEVPAADNTKLVADERGMVRYAYVVETGRGDGANRLLNFSYKEMTEFSGPIQSDCPERLLKLLSPLADPEAAEGSSSWARAWRQRCQRRADLDKALVVGREFKLSEVLGFSDGVQADRFRLVFRKGATMKFRRTIDNRMIRLSADQISQLQAA